MLMMSLGIHFHQGYGMVLHIEYGLDNSLVWGCTDSQGACVTDAECCAGLCSEQGVCEGPASTDEVSIFTLFIYNALSDTYCLLALTHIHATYG